MKKNKKNRILTEDEMLYGKEEKNLLKTTEDYYDTDAVTVEDTPKDKTIQWFKDYLKAFGCVLAISSMFLPVLIISIKIIKYFGI